MQCEETRNLILESDKQGLSETDAQRIRNHLASCPECRKLASTVDAVAALAKQWEDREPPEWNRVPGILRAQSQWRLRMNWLPLAAALILACLVLLRLEVRLDDDGFVVSFGGTAQSAVDQAKLDEFRDQVMTELRDMEAEQSEKLDDALFLVQSNQNQMAKDLLVTLMERNRQERRDEMTRLFANWRKQRRSDLDMLGTQVQTLYEGQVKNRKDLVAIAQFVDDRPFTP